MCLAAFDASVVDSASIHIMDCVTCMLLHIRQPINFSRLPYTWHTCAKKPKYLYGLCAFLSFTFYYAFIRAMCNFFFYAFMHYTRLNAALDLFWPGESIITLLVDNPPPCIRGKHTTLSPYKNKLQPWLALSSGRNPGTRNTALAQDLLNDLISLWARGVACVLSLLLTAISVHGFFLY